MTTTCDWCEEGNVAVDGWHDYPPEVFGDEGYRVPCAVNPPVRHA